MQLFQIFLLDKQCVKEETSCQSSPQRTDFELWIGLGFWSSSQSKNVTFFISADISSSVTFLGYDKKANLNPSNGVPKLVLKTLTNVNVNYDHAFENEFQVEIFVSHSWWQFGVVSLKSCSN